MAVEPGSRYDGVETATLSLRRSDGSEREVRYLRRRFLPQLPRDAEVLAEHRVVDGDRPDNLAARYLDDPLQFWRLADANGVLHPLELTARIGRVVRITLPRI